MHFFRSLFGVAKAHPFAFVGFLFVVILTLGGAAWWVIGQVVGLVRKVSPAVGDKALNAVGSVAKATGSV